MPLEDDIPELKQEHRDLLMLLRAAICGEPPDLTNREKHQIIGLTPSAAPVNWPKVLEIARFHQVDMFLYPHVAKWLKEGSLNEIPSETQEFKFQVSDSGFTFQPPPAPCALPHALLPSPELMAGWRTAYFAATVKYERASAQLKEILQALHAANIPVIPLKGAWLAEKVYDEGAMRPMCDLDLLVPLEKLDQARSVFKKIGYTTRDSDLVSEYDKDILYRHTSHPMMVELHFSIWYKWLRGTKAPSTDRLWIETIRAELDDVPVMTFPPERHITYLAQHIIHHSLTIPLRSYLDLILISQKHTFNSDRLETEAKALGVPFGSKVVIQLAMDLAGRVPEAGLATFLTDATHHTDERNAALRSILEMTAGSSLIKPEMADSREASMARKLVIGIGVVFKHPRYIRAAYPEAVRRFGLMGGYWTRIRDLLQRSAPVRKKLNEEDPSIHADFNNFQERFSIKQWIQEKDMACLQLKDGT